MNASLLRTLALIGFGLYSCLCAQAQIELPAFFADHMVLQRDRPIRIWGKTEPGSWLRLSLAERVTVVTADAAGNWVATIGAVPAGGPYELSMLTATNTKIITDVWVGEVWFCMGQSNMEWPLRKAASAAEEIPLANIPELRYFKVPYRMRMQACTDLQVGHWSISTPETAPYYSAIAYYFAKKRLVDTQVPIGIIEASWGATGIASWMSPTALAGHPDYGPIVNQMANLNLTELQDSVQQAELAWKDSMDSLDIGLKENWMRAELNGQEWPSMLLPQPWERGGPLPVDGVLWFKTQFVLNASQASQALQLLLGVLDDEDQTYVNGHLVGETRANYRASRDYHVPDSVLLTGENTITVRIKDYGYVGGFIGEAEDMKLKQGDWTYALAGDWKYQQGTVDLGPRPRRIGPNTYPTLLYNGMVHPFRRLGTSGMLWYQGESDLGSPYHYRDLFLQLVDDYRQQWRMGDFPFLWAQLPYFRTPLSQPMESGWATMRESQARVLKRRQTGMVVLIDQGDPHNIHPIGKNIVGQRFAELALAISTAEAVEPPHWRPSIEQVKIEGNEVKIRFRQLGEGLRQLGEEETLSGFSIAGANGRFQWAEAKLVSANEIVVSNLSIPAPLYVRYAWADNPGPLNLFDAKGWPLAPFRTDQLKVPWE